MHLIVTENEFVWEAVDPCLLVCLKEDSVRFDAEWWNVFNGKVTAYKTLVKVFFCFGNFHPINKIFLIFFLFSF